MIFVANLSPPGTRLGNLPAHLTLFSFNRRWAWHLQKAGDNTACAIHDTEIFWCSRKQRLYLAEEADAEQGQAIGDDAEDAPDSIPGEGMGGRLFK